MVNINLEKCTGCGLCEKDCFPRNIYMKDGKPEFVTVNCIRCGHCVAICPENAAEITDYDMTEVKDIGEQSITADDLITMIKMRRSVRHFTDKAVEPELISQIIEAGRFTPTASNRQEITFIVVEKEMQMFRALVLESLAEKGRAILSSDNETPILKQYAQRWIDADEVYKRNPNEKDIVFLDAPVVFLLAGDHSIDAGLAASNMGLIADANKLGVLYSGFIMRALGSEKVKNAVGVPPGKEVLTTLLVGYPAVKYRRNAPRRKADVVWI